MKRTSKEFMEWLGLQVGDRIEVDGRNDILEVIKKNMFIRLCNENGDEEYPLYYLLNEDFEILPRPKRVGELTCKNVSVESCNKCPIRCICNVELTSDTTPFYEILEDFKYDDIFDQEIYDLLKTRLDKEVLNNE